MHLNRISAESTKNKSDVLRLQSEKNEIKLYQVNRPFKEGWISTVGVVRIHDQVCLSFCAKDCCADQSILVSDVGSWEGCGGVELGGVAHVASISGDEEGGV